ncbi:MAG: toxin-antitoxin system TumE family protein [Rhodanobacteraceae bacterium]
MPDALCLIKSKVIQGRWIIQRTVLALKYRLFCGDAKHCLVRYDNEAGKGDHRHYGQHEEPYTFTTLETLLEDFQADVIRLTQE